MTKIIEIANAKINLTLDVVAKRQDGYHEVRMVMQSISLSDTLEITADNQICMSCNDPGLPTDDNNLVVKAAKAILKDINKGVKINLLKSIPLEAGMAGGSSDAAAALRGINKLYGLNKSQDELKAIAKTLGADVPFCVTGGTALAEGIGEKLTPLPAIPKLWLVIVKPLFGVSTATVYKALKLENISKHPETQKVLEAIRKGDRDTIVANFCNVLEDVTLKLKPELLNIKQRLLELGAENVLMSGSGPTVFGVFPSEAAACDAMSDFKNSEVEVFVAHTL